MSSSASSGPTVWSFSSVSRIDSNSRSVGHHGLVVVLLADVLGDGHQGLEQDGDVLLALAVEADADHVALVDLELQPRATARDQLGGVDVLVRGLVGGALEVDARRPDQLGDDDALGAVDDEGAAVGHEREVAHEDRLALDLTGVVVGELRRDVERSGVGEVLLLALIDGVLGVVEDRVLEGERHGLAEVLDRGDLLEDLLQTGLARDVLALAATSLDRSVPRLVADQPVEAVGLEGEELRDLKRLLDLREGDAAGVALGEVVRVLPEVLRAAKTCPYAELADEWRRPTTYARPSGQVEGHLRAGARAHDSAARRTLQHRTSGIARTTSHDHEGARVPGQADRRSAGDQPGSAVEDQLEGSVVLRSSTSHSSPTLSMVTVTWFL